MSLEPGNKVKILKTASHYPFEIGQVLVIWRTCVDGYKVIQCSELPEEGNPEWWYVEENEVEVLIV